MNILKLERFFQIDAQSDSLDRLRLKYDKLLHLFNFRANAEHDGIYFKRVLRYRGDAFNIFRDGHIDFLFKNGKLHINWYVKLDVLYFLSGLIGLASGFTISLYFNTPLFLTIIAGLGGTILSIMIGVMAIFIKIDEINESCLHR